MTANRVSDFAEDFARSEASDVAERVMRRLREYFPSCENIRKAGRSNDKLGADCWLEFPGGQHRSVDLKVRSEDWASRGEPAVAVELWSNLERQRPGWAMDATKLTDYVLFYWTDTNRSLLVDARLLHGLSTARSPTWAAQRQATTRTMTAGGGTYSSVVVYLSDQELLRELARWQMRDPRAKRAA